MDKIYNKNDTSCQKFDPLNNYGALTLCTFYNAMCNTHKTKLFLYTKKIAENYPAIFQFV